MVLINRNQELEFMVSESSPSFKSIEQFFDFIDENQIKILNLGYSKDTYLENNAYVCPWLIDHDQSSLEWAIQNKKPLLLNFDDYRKFAQTELEETNPDFSISGEHFNSAYGFPTYAHLTMFMDINKAAILFFGDDKENQGVHEGYTIGPNGPQVFKGSKKDFEKIGKNIFWTAHSFDSIFTPPLYYAVGINDPIVFTSIKEIFRYNAALIEYSESRATVIDPSIESGLPNSEVYEPGIGDNSENFKMIQAAFNRGEFKQKGLPYQLRGEKKEGNDGGVSIDNGSQIINIPVRNGVHYIQVKDEPEVIRRFKGVGRKGPKNADILARYYDTVNQETEFLVKMLKNGPNYLVTRKIIGFTLEEALNFEDENGMPYAVNSLELVSFFNENNESFLSTEDKKTLLNIDYGKIVIDCFPTEISSVLNIQTNQLNEQEPDEIFTKLPLDFQNKIINNYPALKISRYLERTDSEGLLVRDDRFVAAYMNLVGPFKKKSMELYGRWTSDTKPDNIIIDANNNERPVLVDPYLEYSLLQKEFVLTVGSPNFIMGSGERYQEIVDEFREKYVNAHNIDFEKNRSEYLVSELVATFEINMMESKNALNDSTTMPEKTLFEAMTRFNQGMISLEEIYIINSLDLPEEEQNRARNDFEYMSAQLQRAHTIRLSKYIMNSNRPESLIKYIQNSHEISADEIQQSITHADSMFGL